jgi:hypothetical protein
MRRRLQIELLVLANGNPITRTHEIMTTETPTEPRFERFRITYPSGTVFDSYYLIEGGGTLREVQVEHPLAVIEADETTEVVTP